MRLNALVTPTIQATDSGAANHPMWMGEPNRCTTGASVMPSATAINAPRKCAASFHLAVTPRMSSTMETRRIGSTPAAIGSISSRGSFQRPLVRSGAAATAMAMDATTARPPSRGMGRVCTFRSPGMSTAPTSTATRAANGVNRYESTAAKIPGRMNQRA
jgi:hypothetical protein